MSRVAQVVFSGEIRYCPHCGVMLPTASKARKVGGQRGPRRKFTKVWRERMARSQKVRWAKYHAAQKAQLTRRLERLARVA